MRQIVDLGDGEIAEVTDMFDIEGNETSDRYKAEAIVISLANGAVLTGEVRHPEGIHPVH